MLYCLKLEVEFLVRKGMVQQLGPVYIEAEEHHRAHR